MPGNWQPIPITNGVVLRDAGSIGVGELASASNLRLIPGDNARLHLDEGRARVLEGMEIVQGVPGESIVAIKAITFEIVTGGQTFINRYMLAVTTDGTSSYIRTAQLDSTIFGRAQTITGRVTRADIVHAGNEYFVLTNRGNYVVMPGPTSRDMGMNAPVAMVEVNGISTAPDAAGDGHNQYDYYAYVWTEYDSLIDVESAPVAWMTFPTSTDDTVPNYDLLQDGYVQVNSNADKLRLYRTFVGNDGEASSALQARATRIATGADGGRTMGLIEQFDISDLVLGTLRTEPQNLGNLDTSIAYPAAPIDVFNGGLIAEILVEPEAATIGAFFQDCLVLNRTDGSPVLQYSPPGQYEYQPAPFFMTFLSEHQDSIVGIRQIGDTALVLTTSAAYRANYLPFVGFISGQQGRTVTTITSRHGCVGRRAFSKVETPAGEFVVWLSPQSLIWSDGVGWDDACPDFTTEGANFDVDIEKSVLINNPRKYRLELYQPAQPGKNLPMRRWDFYYHGTHLKNGKMKLMGPTNLLPATGEMLFGGTIIDATTALVDGKFVLYTTDGFSIWKEGVGVPGQGTVFETGHLTAPDRFTYFMVEKVGLTHSKSARFGLTGQLIPLAAKCRVVAAISGSNPVTEEVDLPGGFARDESSEVAVKKGGHWFQIRWTMEPKEFSAGPLWLKVTGGNND